MPGCYNNCVNLLFSRRTKNLQRLACKRNRASRVGYLELRATRPCSFMWVSPAHKHKHKQLSKHSWMLLSSAFCSQIFLTKGTQLEDTINIFIWILKPMKHCLLRKKGKKPRLNYHVYGIWQCLFNRISDADLYFNIVDRIETGAVSTENFLVGFDCCGLWMCDLFLFNFVYLNVIKPFSLSTIFCVQYFWSVLPWHGLTF